MKKNVANRTHAKFHSVIVLLADRGSSHSLTELRA